MQRQQKIDTSIKKKQCDHEINRTRDLKTQTFQNPIRTLFFIQLNVRHSFVHSYSITNIFFSFSLLLLLLLYRRQVKANLD